MRHDATMPGGVTCLAVAALMAAALLAIVVRLREEQVNSAALHGFEMGRQSERLIQTAAARGRILDRNGVVLAENRLVPVIAFDALACQKKTWNETARAIREAIDGAASAIGRRSPVSDDDIRRHMKKALPRPMTVWRDVTPDEAARFFEHEKDLPGFVYLASFERRYPLGSLAAHAIGYVGRDRAHGLPGGEKFDYADFEMRGRSGLEYYYDSYLRGVPGEKTVRVDARGFARGEETLVEPKKGLDLVTSLDVSIQAAVERTLEGCKGACVVLDPETGEVLAMASAPGYDLSSFVPVLGKDLYRRLSEDPALPLLNRAVGGTYAPGSTFKPVTALAAISSGISPDFTFECEGVFSLPGMSIRCTRTWGHGEMSLAEAMRESCNPYFCRLGMDAGLDNVREAAFALGLGSPSGVDFPVDAAGVVPDGDWKMKRYSTQWFPGDLAQMSIGQGMLLVTPLQMARAVAAIGTGRLVVPVMRAGERGASAGTGFSGEALDAVRAAMRKSVENGTGRKGAEGVDAYVIGKTGMAEVGSLSNRRKNAWFIAYAVSRGGDRSVALAIVVENGESGGSTAAPKAGAILRSVFGTAKEAENV